MRRRLQVLVVVSDRIVALEPVSQDRIPFDRRDLAHELVPPADVFHVENVVGFGLRAIGRIGLDIVFR